VIGQRQQQKILKNLIRRGLLRGQVFRGSDIKGFRTRNHVSVEDFARWCSVSADVIYKMEKTPDTYVDGGIASTLKSLAVDYERNALAQRPRPVEQLSQEGSSKLVEQGPSLSSDLTSLAKPTESVAELDTVLNSLIFSPTDMRVINRVRALDLERVDLRTSSQKSLAAVDIWVDEKGITQFVVDPKVASSKLPKPIRAKICGVLKIADRDLLEAWRLYRQVECGTRCLVAIQRVRRGELSANSACQDYDAKGWNPSDARRGITEPKAKKKAKFRASISLIEDDEDGDAATNHDSSATDAAEQTQAVIGGLHIKLVKFERDFANDPELLTLVQNMRRTLGPHYQEIKRIVLRRAHKKTNKRRARRLKAGRNTPKGGDQ